MIEDLQTYIQQSRAKGMSDDQIRQNLLSAGWQEGDVNQAFGVGTASARSGKMSTWVKILIGAIIIMSLIGVVLTIFGNTVFYNLLKKISPRGIYQEISEIFNQESATEKTNETDLNKSNQTEAPRTDKTDTTKEAECVDAEGLKSLLSFPPGPLIPITPTNKVPPNFPVDLPQYPKSKVIATAFKDPETGEQQTWFCSEDDPAKIIAFFQLPHPVWTIQSLESVLSADPNFQAFYLGPGGIMSLDATYLYGKHKFSNKWEVMIGVSKKKDYGTLIWYIPQEETPRVED